MAVVGMKQLLEAGVHFGHQTRRWNPKMKPYIYTERNGIHIIDLQKTVSSLEKAYAFVQDLTREGGKVLFVGTKKQAQDAVAEEAARAEQFYVNQRWLGGLLTNFQTIQQRLKRLNELEQMRDTGVFERLPKKEQLKLGDEIAKLNKMLGGIRGMRRLPDALFIVDTKKEHIAIHEARRLDIPIVALLDTNSDPDEVDYAIPANDDAIRAVRLLSGKIADAAHEGAQERASTLAKDDEEQATEADDYSGGYTADPEGYDSSIDGEKDPDASLLAFAAPGDELVDEAGPATETDSSGTPVAVSELSAAPSVEEPASPAAQTGVVESESSDLAEPETVTSQPRATDTNNESADPSDAHLAESAEDAEEGTLVPAAAESGPGIHPDAAD